MGTAFRFVVFEVATVSLPIFNAAGASVPRAVAHAFFVVLVVSEGKPISTEGLSNDTTTVVVHLLFTVLAAG